MENLSMLQDKELVKLLQNGSRTAFEELYARYKKPLILSCKRYLKNGTYSEDIVQDIFLQLWDKRESLIIEVSFSAYVQTMVQNRIFNERKKFDVHLRYTQNIIMNENEATNATEDMIIDNDYANLLAKLIDSLTPQQKEVFRLSRIKGLTYKEIADLLQISLPTVKKHASLALDKIKKQLMKYKDIEF